MSRTLDAAELLRAALPNVAIRAHYHERASKQAKTANQTNRHAREASELRRLELRIVEWLATAERKN